MVAARSGAVQAGDRSRDAARLRLDDLASNPVGRIHPSKTTGNFLSLSCGPAILSLCASCSIRPIIGWVPRAACYTCDSTKRSRTFATILSILTVPYIRHSMVYIRYCVFLSAFAAAGAGSAAGTAGRAVDGRLSDWRDRRMS